MDEGTAERACVVTVAAERAPCETLVEQVEQERLEHGEDRFADGDVLGKTLPPPWPVLEVRARLQQSLMVI